MQNNMIIINKLAEILGDNKNKRICVVGTSCLGKTTLLNQIPNCLDMDDLLFPLLTKEEEDYLCQIPWTEDIGKKMNILAKDRIKISTGYPVFGTVVLDSDLIIYLKIDDEELYKRTHSRGIDFETSIEMDKKIKEDIISSNIPYITFEIKLFGKK